MPPGEIVPSFVMLPVKFVLVTATQGVVFAAGLSKLALMFLAQAANAAGAPPPMSSAATEVDSRRRLRPRPVIPSPSRPVRQNTRAARTTLRRASVTNEGRRAGSREFYGDDPLIPARCCGKATRNGPKRDDP